METSDLLGQIFQSVPDAQIVFKADDPDFTIAEVNNKHLDFSGLKREDILGKSIHGVFPNNPDETGTGQADQLKETFRRVISTQKSIHLPVFRYDVKNSEGTVEERYWSSRNTPIFDEAGKVTFILQSVTEVTKQVEHRIETKEKLLESLSLLRQTELLASTGGWSFDAETKTVFWSDGVYRMCAYEPHEFELTYERSLAVIHPDDRDKALEAIQKGLEKDQEYSMRKRFVTKQGDVRQILSRGTIFRNDEGKPEKVIGVSIDDNGVGFCMEEGIDKVQSLGMNIIQVLTQQLEGKHRFQTSDEGTSFELTFRKQDTMGTGSANL